MSRGKRRSAGVRTPPASQDGRPLERALTAGVSGAIATVATAVDQQQAALTLLERAEVRTARLELQPGRRGGTVLLEPPGGLSAKQIGAPVIVTQAPGSAIADAEFGLVLFVGEVLNARQMRIGWFSSSPAPRVVDVNYIIGSR